MTVSALLVAASLASVSAQAPNIPATPAPEPAVAPVMSGVRFEDQQGEPRGQRIERPHQFGVGAQMGLSNQGGGGGMRYFVNDRLGVNFTLAYYQGPRYSSNPNAERGSTFAAMPSFLYMITLPDKTRDVDIRPYVGGGVNYVRASRPFATTGGNVTLVSQSGMGGQAMGGIEMTFRSADWITISAEGTYYRLPVNYVDGFIVDGFHYNLGFHFYLR